MFTVFDEYGDATTFETKEDAKTYVKDNYEDDWSDVRIYDWSKNVSIKLKPMKFKYYVRYMQGDWRAKYDITEVITDSLEAAKRQAANLGCTYINEIKPGLWKAERGHTFDGSYRSWLIKKAPHVSS